MTDPRLHLGPQVTAADKAACQEALDSIRPIVKIDRGLDPGAAAAAAALVHLLGRLHPHAIVDGDAPLPTNPWGAHSVAAAAALVPRPPASTDPRRDLVVAVGEAGAADLWVGGDDWTAAVSASPVAARGHEGALGVHGAAALAAAEVLKVALGRLGLVHARALPMTIWNLLDHRRTPAPTVTEGRDAGPAVGLFGAGSVGSSIAALLALSGPGASATIVDPDSFDPSGNAYRYPASTTGTEGSKSAWAAAMLAAAGWDAVGCDLDVGAWVRSRAAAGFDGVVASSVDRVDARADVADALARTVLSVGVGGLAFHVQREHPVDDFACPYCQYLCVGSPLSQLAVYEQQTGIPMARIAELLAGSALGQGDIERAVAAGRIHQDGAGDLVGRRFEDLVRRAYAQATVRPASGHEVALSSPSVSWLAGTVVAAEIRKIQKSLPALDRRVDVDLGGVPTGMVRRVPRDRSGRCLCANPFRLRAARRMYGV